MLAIVNWSLRWGVWIRVYLRNTLCDFNIHALMLQNVSVVSGCGYSTVPEATLDIQVCTLVLISCRGGAIHKAHDMIHISIHYCSTMHESSSWFYNFNTLKHVNGSVNTDLYIIYAWKYFLPPKTWTHTKDLLIEWFESILKRLTP